MKLNSVSRRLGLFVIVVAVLQRPIQAEAQGHTSSGVRQGVSAFQTGAFAEAYGQWSAAADAGDPQAARFIGVMYDTGEGVRQDRAMALHWYRRAAEAGDRVAMFNVAVIYDSADNGARDPAKAAQWYRRASAHRVGRAEYNLALMEEQGDGIPRSRADAIRLFKAAARDGVPAANQHLGRLERVTTSVTLAPSRPEDDGDLSFRKAQQALLSRAPSEVAAAFSLFQDAAARHNAMAEYDVGWCYENGVGVKADRHAAYGWYVRAAAETTDPALRSLAVGAASGVSAGATDTAGAAAPRPQQTGP